MGFVRCVCVCVGWHDNYHMTSLSTYQPTYTHTHTDQKVYIIQWFNDSFVWRKRKIFRKKNQTSAENNCILIFKFSLSLSLSIYLFLNVKGFFLVFFWNQPIKSNSFDSFDLIQFMANGFIFTVEQLLIAKQLLLFYCVNGQPKIMIKQKKM